MSPTAYLFSCSVFAETELLLRQLYILFCILQNFGICRNKNMYNFRKFVVILSPCPCSIESRCEVLTSRDYSSRHPVNYLEKDVYLCDTRYDETHHKFGKLPESKLYLNNTVSTGWYIIKQWEVGGVCVPHIS